MLVVVLLVVEDGVRRGAPRGQGGGWASEAGAGVEQLRRPSLGSAAAAGTWHTGCYAFWLRMPIGDTSA